MEKKARDLFVQMREKAKQHEDLYHYTSFESLKKIVMGNSLRLSRIDLVNDPEENKRIRSCWNSKVYLLCFTYTIDNEKYYYENYGKIRLKFKNQEFYKRPVFFDDALSRECKIIEGNLKDYPDYYGEEYTNDYFKSKKDIFGDEKDWQIKDSSFVDVFYCDELKSYETPEGFEKNAGMIKQKIGIDNNGKERNWEIEKETRLRLTLQVVHYDAYIDGFNIRFAHSPFKHLYMPLPKIEEISLSPEMEQEERKEVIDFLKEKGLYHLLND